MEERRQERIDKEEKKRGEEEEKERRRSNRQKNGFLTLFLFPQRGRTVNEGIRIAVVKAEKDSEKIPWQEVRKRPFFFFSTTNLFLNSILDLPL